VGVQHPALHLQPQAVALGRGQGAARKITPDLGQLVTVDVKVWRGSLDWTARPQQRLQQHHRDHTRHRHRRNPKSDHARFYPCLVALRLM